MNSRRMNSIFRVVAAAALALVTTPLVRSNTPQPIVCHGGSAAGMWSLPRSSQDGSVDGFLFRDGGGSAPVYHFTGTLTDMPSPCLSCIEGEIQGFLDDGVGPAPDYIVRGRYRGGFLTGSGQFDARIFRPSANQTVGRIAGHFADPPGNSQPGSFDGRWRICQ